MSEPWALWQPEQVPSRAGPWREREALADFGDGGDGAAVGGFLIVLVALEADVDGLGLH